METNSPDRSPDRPRPDEADEEASFDWAEFEAWEARPADDGVPFWLLEE